MNPPDIFLMGADHSQATQPQQTPQMPIQTQIPTPATTLSSIELQQSQASSQLPSPTPPLNSQYHQMSFNQPPPLPYIFTGTPAQLVEEVADMMVDENDTVVLANSVYLLFTFTIDSVRGPGCCQAICAYPAIMDRIYTLLTDEQFKDVEGIERYATGILTNLTAYEEGRAAILDYNWLQTSHRSPLVQSLVSSLRSTDGECVLHAITAINRLIIDTRLDYHENAKIQCRDSLPDLVQLLDNSYVNCQAKCIVLDCLQRFAYGNSQNRLTIAASRGAYLVLRTIQENLHKPNTDDCLIVVASLVLKSLSGCPVNRKDIVENNGISILSSCIEKSRKGCQNPQDGFEILKACLWTLRNVSDLINTYEGAHDHLIDHLVDSLLQILDDYAEDSYIVACVLGILSNLTCNNERIKYFMCTYKLGPHGYNGVDLILKTIAVRSNGDYCKVDEEILEPAVCALCHLTNQINNPALANDAKMRVAEFDILKEIKRYSMMSTTGMSNVLVKAAEKLEKSIYGNY